MSIKRNNAKAAKLYHGTTPIKQLYRGSVRVFGKAVKTYDTTSDITSYTATTYVDVYDTSTSKWYKLNNLNQYEEYGITPSYTLKTSDIELADGYTLLSYVENTSCSYIDTEYNPNSNTKVDLTCNISSTNTSVGCIFGNEQNGARFEWYNGTNEHRVDRQYTATRLSKTYTGDVHAVLDKNIFYIDDVALVTFPLASFSSSYPIYLFNASYAVQNYGDWNTNWSSYYKLYRFKIYDNDILVRDFVPCKSPNNNIGVFDLVQNKFHENKMSDQPLTAGEEVEVRELTLAERLNGITKYTGKIIKVVDKYYKYNGTEWVVTTDDYTPKQAPSN